MAGIPTALANAQGLQTRLFQKFGELKRPVISKSKSAQELEDEERGLKSMQERLNTLEKKLRIFRDLDASKAEERASVMTALDGARRDLLAAAREFEAYSFGSKDVIQNVMEFCQLKQAQNDATPRAGKPSFKSNLLQARRDDQPQQHPDQVEKAAPVRRLSSSSAASGAGTPAIPSVTVTAVPSNLSTSASKRYPAPDSQAAAPQQASLSSRLPRFTGDGGSSAAAASAAAATSARATAPSLNIKMPAGFLGSNLAASESVAPTPTAHTPTAHVASQVPSSLLAKAPGAAAAEPAAAADAKSPPASPLAAKAGLGSNPPCVEHSPQMTQDSSLCNMESMYGAGTYPGTGGASTTTPPDAGAGALGGPPSKVKALMQLHGQDTASSIPFPPAAAGRPRLLDAYIAATQGGVQAREPQQPQPQQQQAVPERLHDARGSELTLGHVIAKPPALAATGTLRPSQLPRPNASGSEGHNTSSRGASSAAGSAHSRGSSAHVASSASTLTLPTHTEPSPAYPVLKPTPAAITNINLMSSSGSSTHKVAASAKPSQLADSRPSDTAAPLLAEAEGSSMTPTPGAAPAHAHAGELSPALSSTRSSSTTPAHAAASEQGSAGSAQQGGLGDSAAMAHAKPYAATAPHAPPSTSMVAKLQQRFLQTPQAPARPDEPEPCTPCADSVHAVLRDGSQRRRTLPLRRTGGSSGLGGGEAEEEGEEEEAWQTEAQRTTARAPAPTSLVQERSAALRRISGGAGVMADPSRTPSSNAAVPAAAATAEAAAGGAPVVAATEGQEHKKTVSTAAAPWAQQAAQLQQRLAGKEACTTAAPTAVAAAPSSGVPAAVLGVDGRAPPAGGLAPTKQQLELLEQRDAYSRVAAEQALLLQPHRQRAAGSAECGHKGGPPTSVLAAGPQLAAAGLVSVPPHFLQQQRQQHPMVARGCGEEWGPGEGTAEEEEEEEEEGVTAQQQVLLGGRRRHTAPEALQQKQKLHVRAPRSAPAYSQCPSTPSPTYVGSSGRKRKGGGRGMWGGLLRVLGITTTVASVAVVTGAAVFAAAALNTGLDELDLMQPEHDRRAAGNTSKGPFARKGARWPQAGDIRHPNALAAGRG